MSLFSVGHSTRNLEELVMLLREAGVEAIADVRRFPASRRHPQFRREALEAELAACGIRYEWLGQSLGGRRRETIPVEESPNRAWQVPAFRHYADAMVTPEFLRGVERIEALARAAPTAFLCAERRASGSAPRDGPIRAGAENSIRSSFRRRGFSSSTPASFPPPR